MNSETEPMTAALLGIETVGLSKDFRGILAVNDVRLTIPAGQFVVVLGPSGCGKSTLLKLIAGLESSSQGEVHVHGKRVSSRFPEQQNVGMVFQDSSLYPHFTVRKNLRFALRPQKLPRTTVDSRVDQVASQLEIDGLLDRYPANLSGGERQRVAIGRAIIRNPQVLLLDEPMSQLDANLRVQLRSLLVALHQQLSATTLYVTHDANEALELADRVIVMQHGVIVQDGSPEEIYDNPVNQWVASFVGDPPINFVQGSLSGKNLSLGDQILLMSKLESFGEDPLAVRVGFRPHHLRIQEQASSGAFTYEAKLQRIYRREDRVTCQIVSPYGEHNLISSNKPTCAPGSHIQVAVSANDLLLFDAQSGIRIR